MTARFEHQRGTNFVGVLLQPRSTLDDGVTGKPRKPARHDTERFAAGMDLDCRNSASDFHVCVGVTRLNVTARRAPEGRF